MRQRILRLIPVLTLLLTFSCRNEKHWYHTGNAVWNTVYHITYQSENNLDDSITVVLNSVDRSLSAFNPNSTVSRINCQKDVVVDDYFERVFNESKDISRFTNGWFDPTIGHIIDLWGFGKNKNDFNSVPSDSLIESCLKHVGIKFCKIENNVLIKKTSETQFNFSAIAKGFGCDEIGRMMERNNVQNYLIEIGGEIAAHGKSPRNRDWIIQVDAPVIAKNIEEMHQQIVKIKVTDCGIATSGNYRNFKETEDGTMIGHTINPHSGYPVESPNLSATVIAQNAMTADAWATAIMAMPIGNTLELVSEHPEIKFFLVSKEQPAYISDSVSNRFKVSTIPEMNLTLIYSKDFPLID